jgi:methionyl-tRNA synthetase
VEVVHDVFLRLLEHGYLYKKESLQYFCPSCDRFLPDRYVEGTCTNCGYEKARGDQCDNCGQTFEAGELEDSRCTNCGEAPMLRETEHYFLKLSAFQQRLLDYVEGNDHWRSNVQTFTRNWLQEGLVDRAITRDMNWGVPVPIEGWDGKVIYVWFEAVIGYLSASKEYAKLSGNEGMWKDFWLDPEVRHYYFLGKDNIPFHTIIWPAMLMGYGELNLPYDVPANEFLTFKGEQFSKSRGISIDIPTLLENFDADVLRYYLSVNMPENRDADFSWEDFEAKVNNELVATLGNYYHRVLSFTNKHFGSIPPCLDEGERDKVMAEVLRLRDEADGHLSGCEFKKALRSIMDLAQFGNRYFDSTKPWALIKEGREACGSALNLNLEIVKALAILTHPYLPRSSTELWALLGQGGTPLQAGWGAISLRLSEGTPLSTPRPLFERIELAKEETKEEIPMQDDTFMEFDKLNLKVGEITEVSDHPDADKLYVMKVDVGEERQIIAGLKRFYSADELRGRKVVVVSNLKPAKLRGLKSEGMLLAADDEDLGGSTVLLLRPAEDVPNGTPVSSGRTPSESRISYSEFEKVTMFVGSLDDAKVDIGRKVSVTLPSATEAKMIAVFAPEGNEALPLFTPDGTVVTVDRDITNGAKVR